MRVWVGGGWGGRRGIELVRGDGMGLEMHEDGDGVVSWVWCGDGDIKRLIAMKGDAGARV